MLGITKLFFVSLWISAELLRICAKNFFVIPSTALRCRACFCLLSTRVADASSKMFPTLHRVISNQHLNLTMGKLSVTPNRIAPPGPMIGNYRRSSFDRYDHRQATPSRFNEPIRHLEPFCNIGPSTVPLLAGKNMIGMQHSANTVVPEVFVL